MSNQAKFEVVKSREITVGGTPLPVYSDPISYCTNQIGSLYAAVIGMRRQAIALLAAPLSRSPCVQISASSNKNKAHYLSLMHLIRSAIAK